MRPGLAFGRGAGFTFSCLLGPDYLSSSSERSRFLQPLLPRARPQPGVLDSERTSGPLMGWILQSSFSPHCAVSAQQPAPLPSVGHGDLKPQGFSPTHHGEASEKMGRAMLLIWGEKRLFFFCCFLVGGAMKARLLQSFLVTNILFSELF